MHVLCVSVLLFIYSVLMMAVVFLFDRYVAQGKGILQPHSLIDELENILGEDQATQELKSGPFGEIIKSAQVTCPHHNFGSDQIFFSYSLILLTPYVMCDIYKFKVLLSTK